MNDTPPNRVVSMNTGAAAASMKKMFSKLANSLPNTNSEFVIRVKQQQDQRAAILLLAHIAGRTHGREENDQRQLQQRQDLEQNRPEPGHVPDVQNDLRAGHPQPGGTHQQQEPGDVQAAIQKVAGTPRQRRRFTAKHGSKQFSVSRQGLRASSYQIACTAIIVHSSPAAEGGLSVPLSRASYESPDRLTPVLPHAANGVQRPALAKSARRFASRANP